MKIPLAPFHRPVPLVLLVLLVLLGAAAAAQTPALPAGAQLYRSNAIGMALERITPQQRGDHTHVLSVERSDGLEVRRLFTGGEETRRWETRRTEGGQRRERVFEDGEPRTVRRFSTDGLLLEETTYRAGGPAERRIFSYAGRRLSSMEVFDGEGTSRFRERYLYTASGSLREVIRIYPAGSRSIASYNFGSGRLEETRHARDGLLRIYRYNSDGTPAVMQLWRDGRLVVEERRTYQPESRVLRTVERDEGRARMLKEYDDRGRLIREVKADEPAEGTTGGAAGREEITYSYDEEGNLERKVSRSSAGRRSWVYHYDDAGELEQESYYVGRSLEKVTVYTEEDARYEEIYRRGRLFLRIYYRGGEKEREEFVRSE